MTVQLKSRIGKAVAAIGAVAVLGAGGAALAEPHGGYGHHNGSGSAVAAGIAGLAIGAALASNHNGYYAQPQPVYYGQPAYYGYDRGYGYGYGRGYERCRTVVSYDRWGQEVVRRICR